MTTPNDPTASLDTLDADHRVLRPGGRGRAGCPTARSCSPGTPTWPTPCGPSLPTTTGWTGSPPPCAGWRLAARRRSGTARPRAERPLLRRLRADGGDRPGRDGGRLQGPAGLAQPGRRPEDDPGRGVRLAARGPAVPRRGRGGGEPRPPPDRPHLRGRRARRAPVLLDEARRGGLAGGAPQGRHPLGGRRADRRGPRGPSCPSARRPAPGPEALERPDRPARDVVCHRLRPGQAALGGRWIAARSRDRCSAPRATWPPSRRRAARA